MNSYKEHILPADTYHVIKKTNLHDDDRNILTMLYQPIMGIVAHSLYYTLWSDLDQNEIVSEEHTHHRLMSITRLDLNNIIEARIKLEAMGLIRTFIGVKDNIRTLVYEIYSPVSAKDFFENPILNTSLYNNLGKTEYEKAKEFFRVPKIKLNNYDEITSSFSDVFVSTPSLNLHDEALQNIDFKSHESLDIKISPNVFDFDLFFASLSKTFVRKDAITKTVKELILKLSYVYNIDAMAMQSIVSNAVTEKGSISKKTLRKSARDWYQLEHDGKLPNLIHRKQPNHLRKPLGDNSDRAKMIYQFENESPYEFIKNSYKGGEPTTRDLSLIESLIIEQELNPGVVNVLIDYVFLINNKKVTKAFVETIAGQWKRLGVETVEEAMKIAEKEHKKYNKIVSEKKVKKQYKPKSNEVIPDWFNTNIEAKELTDESKDELDALLKEYE